MAMYVAQLRQLTQYCEFGDSLEATTDCEGGGPTLLAREWLTELTLNVDWSSLHCVQVRKSLSKVLDKYSAVFNNELGKAKDYVATLQVDPTVEPKFTRPGQFICNETEGRSRVGSSVGNRSN